MVNSNNERTIEELEFSIKQLESEIEDIQKGRSESSFELLPAKQALLSEKEDELKELKKN